MDLNIIKQEDTLKREQYFLSYNNCQYILTYLSDSTGEVVEMYMQNENGINISDPNILEQIEDVVQSHFYQNEL